MGELELRIKGNEKALHLWSRMGYRKGSLIFPLFFSVTVVF